MINKIFNKLKKSTEEDLLNELLQHNFSEQRANDILKAGNININWQNEQKEGFLHICAKNQLTESMKWLFKNEIDVNLETNEGLTALFYGVEANSKAAVSLLIEHNADVDHVNKHNRTALQEAVISNNSNADLHTLNSKGKPLFFDAILYKNSSLFKLLKNHGSNINQKDSDSRNIIYNYMEFVSSQENITMKEYFETLQSLIMQGADVNSRDEFGGTVVHKAILDKCERTVKVLLDSKADIKATDKKGRNLVHNCVWKGKIEHFKLIHRYNSDILNKPDKFGVLPINYAAFMGHKDLVIEMIDRGSYINNPHKKNPKIINFLSKFAKNLDEILKDNESELNKKNINMLIENMKKEFCLN